MKNKLCSGLVALMVLFSLLAGCSSDSAISSYDSLNVYKRPLYSTIAQSSIAYQGVERNPVIVVHGFLGARLQHSVTQDIIWGSFKGSEIINGYSNDHLRALALPMEQGKNLNELKDRVVPIGLLENFDVRILGIKFNLDAYNRLLGILQNAGYVKDGTPLPEGKNYYSLFTFYYDWRRDLPENAAKLHEFILAKRRYLQDEYQKKYGIKDYDVQFDVIGHSMGGLLSRYYMRFGGSDLPADGTIPKITWAGSKYLDKIIIVGTPNAGYLDTFIELQNGLKIDPSAPIYPPAVLGTFHTYYQMLPLNSTKSIAVKGSSESVDIFDPEFWIKMNLGLANPTNDETLKILLPKVSSREERRAIAIDHLRKCLKRARHFTDALRMPATPPDDVSFHLFLGDAVHTSRKAAIDPMTNIATVVEYEAGDGKVLASSARFDVREGQPWTPFFQSPIKWRSIMHLSAAHMGITTSTEFADNAIFCLLEQMTVKQEQNRNAMRQIAIDKQTQPANNTK